MGGKLRLKATDFEDLGVIAAFLQDARVPLKEMVFSPEERRFMAAFTRYRREDQEDPSSCEGLAEVQSALVFEDIEDAKHRGLDAADLEREHVLLTIATEPGTDHVFHVDLVFEGEARIRLRTDRISCRLDDFGETIPARITPCDHFAASMPGWFGEKHADPA
jgi:hypothetical protein